MKAERYPAHGSATGWFNGDFNYDGVVDSSDYTLIDNGYNRQTAPIPAAGVATPAGRAGVFAASPPIGAADDQRRKKVPSVASQLDALR